MSFQWVRTPGEDFATLLTREWLETNIRGSYASGTALNCHTRKYHGLLVTALERPPGVFVLVSQLEDFLHVGNTVCPLVTHQYPELFYPDSWKYLRRFQADPVPSFDYSCGNVSVTRSTMLLHDQDTVLVKYSLQGGEAGMAMEIRPLMAYRNIHKVSCENQLVNFNVEIIRNGFEATPYRHLPKVRCQVSRPAAFVPDPQWYRNCIYERDREREFDHREDLFSPGALRVPLNGQKEFFVVISTTALRVPPATLWNKELRRRQAARTAAADAASRRLRYPAARELYQTLYETADKLLIQLPDGTPAVHAGYHWFGPWGRDTLIALPGLAFLRGKLEQGLDILTAVAEREKNGLLPNFINPDGTGAYTAADPALWLFWTVQQYLKYGGSKESIRESLWPAMRRIIQHCRKGTASHVAADVEGLLRAGSPGTAVSWMDAQIGGRPIVQRWGYMIEINALWYNALCFAKELAADFKSPLPGLSDKFLESVRKAFIKRFWQPQARRLADTVNDYFTDVSVRPNQLFAVSLPFSPLPPEIRRDVMNTLISEGLVTAYGLRSLSPEDMRYQPVCRGPHFIRELAYHQGSVWPWLQAHFADGLRQAFGDSADLAGFLAPSVCAFLDHLRQAGVGAVSELFEGDPPHTPRGAVCQAWNVGELLRMLHEAAPIAGF
jgi:predicted glycogen debranching enzyme